MAQIAGGEGKATGNALLYYSSGSHLKYSSCTQSWFSKTFDACVLNPADVECPADPVANNLLIEQQLTYFCGSATECLLPVSRPALARAKRNLEEGYAVVGVAGDVNTSLKVMAAYLPRFFIGATKLYEGMADAYKHRNAVGRSRNVSSEAEHALKSMFGTELEFYSFAAQRLKMQLRAVKIREMLEKGKHG